MGGNFIILTDQIVNEMALIHQLQSTVSFVCGTDLKKKDNFIFCRIYFL